MNKVLFYFLAAMLGVSAAVAGSYVFQPHISVNESLSIYFFYSDSCPHCKQVKPHVAELADKFKVTYCNIASLSGKCLEVAEKLRLKYVPTLVVFQNNSSSIYVGSDEVMKFIKEVLK